MLVPSPFPCSSSQFLIAARPGGAFAGAVRLWAARPAAGAASGHAGGSDCAGSPAAQPAETCARQVCRFTIKLYIHGLCGYLLQCSRACGVLWYLCAQIVRSACRDGEDAAAQHSLSRSLSPPHRRLSVQGSSQWDRLQAAIQLVASPAGTSPRASGAGSATWQPLLRGSSADGMPGDGVRCPHSSCCTRPVVSRLHTHGLRYDAEQLNQLRRYVSNACVDFAK